MNLISTTSAGCIHGRSECVHAHPKWRPDCGGRKDTPDTEYLKTLLFCKTQECIDKMHGFTPIGNGMQTRNRACICSATD